MFTEPRFFFVTVSQSVRPVQLETPVVFQQTNRSTSTQSIGVIVLAADDLPASQPGSECSAAAAGTTCHSVAIQHKTQQPSMLT